MNHRYITPSRIHYPDRSYSILVSSKYNIPKSRERTMLAMKKNLKAHDSFIISRLDLGSRLYPWCINMNNLLY